MANSGMTGGTLGQGIRHASGENIPVLPHQYVPNSPVWHDETGVGDGTPFTAFRMNYIENGILALSNLVSTVAVTGVQGTVNFGFPTGSEGDTATVTVAAPWVTPTSTIVCMPAGVATADHDPEDATVEGISAVVTNIVAGTGFDIEATAPNGTWGQYVINAVGGG
jgi:hypothetical protein